MRITSEFERKIDELLIEMTLEEKVSLCHANARFYSNGVERLGIEELAMMDGPHGVRSEPMRHDWTCLNREEDKCTYLPTETALAATFNPELARRFGETLGSEARYREKDIILGPGINVIRTPLCGRNFEYMSEDPCLIGKMSSELVKGIESQDTAACVKHFALNNQELDRHNVNVEVSDRALHEIYLKGFYSAIIEGGASSVMGAYNKYRNQHLCHNKYLVKDILKDKWGFKGVYLSDWAGCYDTDEAIYNGLDIEMGTFKPYNEYYLADAFLEKAKQNDEVREILDDKVRRILRLMFSINKLGSNRKKGEFNTKKHQNTTYDIAAEAMVLLKNENNILPIDKSKLKKLLVVGSNATVKHAGGGSSSGIRTVYEITPLEGIENRLSDFCEIEYIKGELEIKHHHIPTQILNIIEPKAGVRAVKQVSYKKNQDGNLTEKIDFCSNTELKEIGAEAYDLHFNVAIPETGKIGFKINSSVGYVLKIDGNICLEQEFGDWEAENFFSRDREYMLDLKEGDNIDIEIHIDSRGHKAVFDFGWLTPSESSTMDAGENSLLQKASEADYVIYCGGLDHCADTEGMDRNNMQLPLEQNAIISELSKVNKNTIVVITAGSAVEMPWIDKVNSVIWGWYAGMEGGNALADILTGDIVPSGKMPFTLAKKYEDYPVARYGEHKEVNCKYNDDILVGYRGFDYDNIEPMFPFGHGISYSNFEYSDLEISTEATGAVISFSVKNTGKVTAKETAQVYIGDPICSVMRPIKELRNFKKVELKPREKAKISLPIKESDLSFYDEIIEDWKLEKGEFTVFVGSSSRDIRLNGSFII